MVSKEVKDGLRKNCKTEEEYQLALKNAEQYYSDYDQFMHEYRKERKKHKYQPNKETDFFTMPIESYLDDIKREDNPLKRR